MIRFWNRGAERIFGYAASEALGRPLDIIIPEHLRARHWEAYDRTMHSGQTRYGDGEAPAVPTSRKDGTPKPRRSEKSLDIIIPEDLLAPFCSR